jgi:hypothetical protein
MPVPPPVTTASLPAKSFMRVPLVVDPSLAPRLAAVHRDAAGTAWPTWVLR